MERMIYSQLRVVIAIKKDNTLFYLLFLIAVFIVISITKSGTKSKDKPNDSGVKDSPQAPEKTEANDDKKTYHSDGKTHVNNAAPQPSNPGSNEYDYNQGGLAGTVNNRTLNRGKYTK